MPLALLLDGWVLHVQGRALGALGTPAIDELERAIATIAGLKGDVVVRLHAHLKVAHS